MIRWLSEDTFPHTENPGLLTKTEVLVNKKYILAVCFFFPSLTQSAVKVIGGVSCKSVPVHEQIILYIKVDTRISII